MSRSEKEPKPTATVNRVEIVPEEPLSETEVSLPPNYCLKFGDLLIFCGVTEDQESSEFKLINFKEDVRINQISGITGFLPIVNHDSEKGKLEGHASSTEGDAMGVVVPVDCGGGDDVIESGEANILVSKTIHEDCDWPGL